MSTANGIDVIGEVSEPEYSPEDFDSMEGYLSNQFGSEAYKAEDAIDDPSVDIGKGDTLVVVEEDAGKEAYVVDGPLRTPEVGNTEEVVDYGILGTGDASATANKYDFEVADNVSAMHGTNVAAANGNFQKRNETTDVSLEPEEEQDGFVNRALENHEPIQ